MSTTLPRRHNTEWLPLEHYHLAHAFARNGFAYLPPEHPEVVALATYWQRTPNAVAHQTWLYASDDPGYNRSTPHVAFGYAIVQALRMAQDGETVAVLRAVS